MLYALLFIAAAQEEKLNTAYKRMTTTTSSLTFNTFQGAEKVGAPNSHILVGNSEALLVDAQLTTGGAKRLVKMIKDIGKPLTKIVITSPHPDRYLGLPVVTAAFPEARVVAAPAVAKDIAAEWTKAVEQARAQYPKEDIPDPGVPPVAADKLELSGNAIQLIVADGGETPHGSALYVPSLSVLIPGNLVTGKGHAAVDKKNPRWRALLDELKRGRDIGPVLTGRGDVGDASVIEAMKASLK